MKKILIVIVIIVIAIVTAYHYKGKIRSAISQATTPSTKQINNPEADYYNEMLQRAKDSNEYTTYKKNQEKELRDNLDAKLHTIAWQYMNQYTIKVMNDYSETKVQNELNKDSCLRYENKQKAECKEVMKK